MKNELTPQIAAMLIGQKCNVIYNAKIIGPSIRKIDCDVIHWLESGSIEILPHLRRLDSLTESEARELYTLATGMVWEKRSKGSCIDEWWQLGVDDSFLNEWLCVGTPAVWLKLLSWGMDVFNGIESGWAKEVK